MNHIHFGTISSTNDYLKIKYPFLEEWSVVSTDYQEKGRGRDAHSWESENRKNLLCSILIKSKDLLSVANKLPLLTGCVIHDVLVKLKVDEVMIKWPNDIYVLDNKICGILLESVSNNDEIKAVIIGIGLNLNQKEFPKKLNATSYLNETGKTIKIDKVIALILAELKKEAQKLLRNKSKYLETINKFNYLYNKPGHILINGKREEVIFEDINEDGTINVKLNNQIIAVNASEATVIR